MRKSTKIFSALAIAGVVAVAGSAATGNGFVASSTAVGNQFIGGTVSESVVGANLAGISFTQDLVNDPSGATLTGLTLTFADANTDTKTPTVVMTGATAGTFTCNAIGTHSSVAHTSVCTNGGSAANDAVNITSVAVTVS